MIRSMTAFARHAARAEWGELVWELRAVNHRYLEVGLRLPEDMRSLETQCRQAVASRLRRGKVDCSLKIAFDDRAAADIEINGPLLASLLERVGEVADRLPSAAPVCPLSVLRWPGVVSESSREEGPLQQAALEALDAALLRLEEARCAEGARLRELLLQRCDAVVAQTATLRARLPQVRERLGERLRARLGELQAEPDADRFEQELVYLLQKMDVDEELDRLDSHVVEARSVLDRSEPVGRRLDFLMQEFNREANTLASKAQDTQSTRAAVEIKVLVEQMREQVQNLE